ncbi:SCO3933 family regulatory protein [Streptomyces noursei]
MIMQNMPIDVARLGTCLVVVPAEVRVNPETGEVRRDRDGNTLYVVGIAVRQKDRRRADVIEVVVPEEPRGIAEGMPVHLNNLVATAWNIGDRSGVSFRASGVVPAAPGAPPGPASSPPNRGKGGSGGDS